MSKIQDIFVPYEISKLAKEKGFAEPCMAFYECYKKEPQFTFDNCQHHKRYDWKGNNWNKYNPDFAQDDYINSNFVSAPTYDQLTTWFIEKHNLVVTVYANASGYLFEIHDSAEKGGSHKYDSGFTGPNDSGVWNTYLEAKKAAFEQAFKLIK